MALWSRLQGARYFFVFLYFGDYLTASGDEHEDIRKDQKQHSG